MSRPDNYDPCDPMLPEDPYNGDMTDWRQKELEELEQQEGEKHEDKRTD